MAKRRAYDDDFRATAVLMLEAQGYPDTPGAVAIVSKHLNVPERTLRRWASGEQNPPPDQLVRVKRGELSERLDSLLDVLIDEMVKATEGAPLNHLATAFGIAVDKKQLLSGKPTAINEDTVTVNDARERLAQQLGRRAARNGAGGVVSDTD